MAAGRDGDTDEETPLLASRNTPTTVTGTDVAEAPPIDTTSSSSTSTQIDDRKTTPSLVSQSATCTDNEDGSKQDDNDEKPLPVGQVLLLCFGRLIEPVAFFSIFPYINQMCRDNGHLRDEDTGFYAGLIESLFSCTQMLVMIFWGRLSDSYGRRPVLIISLFGLAMTSTLFGFARTLWQMVLFRCAAGVFAGSIVTIRTMLAEHSTSRTQARIFSWFATSGNLGIMLGPLIGGGLADPVKQYPKAFRHSRFLQQYPYALSTLASGVVALVAAVLTLVFVRETLPSKLEQQAIVDHEGTDACVSTPKQDNTKTSIKSLLTCEGVPLVLFLYGWIMVLAYTYTAIIPVFLFEPVHLGGFGFSSLQISGFMAGIGLSQAIWLLLIFPPLQHRIGTGGILRACAYLYPVFFAVNGPILSLLLRNDRRVTDVVFWVLLPVVTFVDSGVSMCFTGIQLALNDVSPSPQTLATLNALALTVVSGVRAVSPVAATSVFAIGIGQQILYGYLAWAVLIGLALVYTVSVRWLPEKAEGRPDQKRK